MTPATPDGISATGEGAPATTGRLRVVAAPELNDQVLLAIDTAIGTSVALGVAGQVFEVSSDDPRGHAERIGTLLAEVFAVAGIASDQVTGVVSGIGPGPFTGLRVGITAAQVFALSRAVPLFPLHGHEAVALESWELLSDEAGNSGTGVVRVRQDAKRREVFVTEYASCDSTGIPVRASGPSLAPLDGDADTPSDVWPERIPAAALVRLAARRLASARAFESAEALYLRLPDVYPPAAPKRVST